MTKRDLVDKIHANTGLTKDEAFAYLETILETIKVRILSLLKDRPLRNADIRNFTDLGRQQAYRIMKELENDGLVCQDGHGQSASWHLKQSSSKP